MSKTEPCGKCKKPVTPSKEAHFHRWIKDNLICFHTDCWQQIYAAQRRSHQNE